MTGKNYTKKDPLYGAAILRVSLELRGLDPKTFGGIVKDTIAGLGVDEKALERYIRKHRAELEATCRAEGLAE